MWKKAREVEGAHYWSADPFAYESFRLMGTGDSIWMMPGAGISNVEVPAGSNSSAQKSAATAIRHALRVGSVNGAAKRKNWLLLSAGFPERITQNTGCFAVGKMCLLYPDDPECSVRGFTVTFWVNIIKV